MEVLRLCEMIHLLETRIVSDWRKYPTLTYAKLDGRNNVN